MIPEWSGFDAMAAGAPIHSSLRRQYGGQGDLFSEARARYGVDLASIQAEQLVIGGNGK
jgi:hypothetical protein